MNNRQLLDLPDEQATPLTPVLRDAMRSVGYEVTARTTRQQLLQMVADHGFTERKALQEELARVGGYTTATEQAKQATPRKANGTKALNVEAMLAAIGRKGYQPTKAPKGKAAVQALYAAIVEQGTIPHSYPTGTRLEAVVGKPTALRVQPEAGQPIDTIDLEVKADTVQAAIRRISQKANRLGLLTATTEPHEGPVGTWTAGVQYVPAAATAERSETDGLDSREAVENAIRGLLA